MVPVETRPCRRRTRLLVEANGRSPCHVHALCFGVTEISVEAVAAERSKL